MFGVRLLLLLAAGLSGLHRIGCALLNRQRYRARQREWLDFGSRWRRDRC